MGLPVELAGEGIGQTRKIPMGETPTVERLESRDEAAKVLSYSIVSGSLPLKDYLSTMQLSDAGSGRTRLDWSSKFEAAGVSDDEAKALVSRIYTGGIAALQAKFGG